MIPAGFIGADMHRLHRFIGRRDERHAKTCFRMAERGGTKKGIPFISGALARSLGRPVRHIRIYRLDYHEFGGFP